MTAERSEELKTLIQRFLDGGDRTLTLANELELALDQWGEREPFASVALALASYRPEGGQLLYSEVDMVPMLAHLLRVLDASPTGSES